MTPRKCLLLASVLLISFFSNAQRSIWDGAYNRLGLQAGVNHFNISTDDLPISSNISWTAGFTSRASFAEEFQFVYGINFYDFKSKISGRQKIDYSSPTEEMDFNMIGVQGNFFISYKIVDHFFSVEAGPVFQLNGKLEPRQDKELWYIDGYDLQSEDISNVSPFNVNLAVGVSGGFEKLKFWAQYQYGITNILNKLNDENLEGIDPSVTNFKGNMHLITAGIAMFL